MQRKEQRDAAVDDLVNRVNNALVSPLGKVSLTSSWMIRKQREREAEEAKVREEQQLNRQFKEQVQQQLAQEYDAKQQEEAKQQALEEAARQLKEQAQQQLAEEHEAKQQKAEEAARQKAIEEAEEASKQKAAEDIKQRLIRELPSEWAARVDTAMAGTNRRETLATSIEGNGLSRHDFGCLLPQPGTEDSPSGWLNDEIVNAWISAIVEEKNIAKDFTKAGNRVPTFAAYSSAWFNTVKDKGMDAISRWSRRKHISGTNLLHCEKVFLPINTGSHWQLLIISPKQKTIEFLDSLRTTSRRRYFLQLGRDWVKMELGKKYVAEEWTESPSESAMQMNEDDCGAFVCFNALIAAKGREYDEMKQYNMKEGRRLMAAILINGGFTGDWML